MLNGENREIILDIMKKSHTNAYFITSVDNQPRARIVSPIIEDDFSIWIITFNSSRKVNEIKNNDKICLTFMEYPNKGSREAVVYGKALIINDLEIKKRLWSFREKNLSQYFKDGYQDKEYCVIKIIIDYIELRKKSQGELEIIKF